MPNPRRVSVDSKIRVIVGRMPRIPRGLLTHLIQCQPDMELVEQDRPDIELIEDVTETLKLLVGAKKANVVLLPLPDSGEMPGICSHLLDVYPALRIIVLSVNGDWVYTAERLLQAPVENILKAIRTASQTNDRAQQ